MNVLEPSIVSNEGLASTRTPWCALLFVFVQCNKAKSTYSSTPRLLLTWRLSARDVMSELPHVPVRYQPLSPLCSWNIAAWPPHLCILHITQDRVIN
jgi:hypothetical protein